MGAASAAPKAAFQELANASCDTTDSGLLRVEVGMGLHPMAGSLRGANREGLHRDFRASFGVVGRQFPELPNSNVLVGTCPAVRHQVPP